jgi:hypothetical protein
LLLQSQRRFTCWRITSGNQLVLNKKDFGLLEKIFSAEINGQLPFHSKSKEYKRLESEGLVQFGAETVGADRFGVIKVSGWYLTHSGRYAYCKSCPDEPEED